MSNVNGLMIAADALGKAAAAGRAHHLPPALHADDLRHLRRLPPGRDLRGHAQDADRPLGRGAGRGLRAGRALAPRPVLPARPARTCTPRSPANAAPPAPRSASSTPRPSARSRSSAPDAVDFMERMYTNPWAKLGVGPLPLRPAARRGRLHPRRRRHRPARRRPLPRHHDDRRRRARAQHDGGLPPDRMAGPRRSGSPRPPSNGRRSRCNGPNARKLLEPLVEGIDISAEAFPHMAVAECTVAGFPARLFRVSFTGELGFEVNVPARHGRALWEAAHARPAGSTTSPPTAPRRCTCCAPRRATSSSARTPTAR